MNARCSGCSRSSVPSPSMVVMRLPETLATVATHERIGLPSARTVHAPHCARPQPNFGPFSSRSLRSTYSSGVSGSTWTVLLAPFTRRVKLAMAPSRSVERQHGARDLARLHRTECLVDVLEPSAPAHHLIEQ